MSGASPSFLAFGLAVVLISHLVWRPAWRQAVLLAASLLFLVWCAEGASLAPLIAFLGLGYAGLKLVESGRMRSATPMVIVVILLFLWLKKYTILPSPVFLRFPYATLGLSYILFRVVHLLEDADCGMLPGRVGVVSYLLYTLNFTSLVAGPIQRYQEFDSALGEGRRPSLRQVGRAFDRIITGFFKANVMGLVFSSIQTAALSQALHAARWETRVAQCAVVIASYPFFLYCNFSGYIDIVIGMAGLLGIRLPENFDRPFSADSFIGFWSRWHITLSNWLRTYVYQPLLMFLLRRYPAESQAPFWSVGAVFVTFFLVGAWHGPTSTYLFFGVLQGLGVGMNQLYEFTLTARLGRKRARQVTAGRAYVAICRGLTFTWFAFTLCWFWSDWPQLAALTAAVGAGGAVAALTLILAAATLGLAAWEGVRGALLRIEWGQQSVLQSRYVRTAWCTALCLVALATEALINQPAPEIVYKRF